MPRGKGEVFRKQRGKDKKVGSDRANKIGGFAVKVRPSRLKRGKYYARAVATSVPKGVCAKAKSKRVRVGGKR